MNLTLGLTRTLFMILSVFFVTVYMVAGSESFSSSNLALGVGLGACLGLLLIGFDLLFKRFNLRSFNIAIIGLFVGYLMGQALVLILSAVLKIGAASVHLSDTFLELLEISLFLFGIYLGTLITIRSSDQFYVSIPFVRLSSIAQKKKDILLDLSVFSDGRILDLAGSGLLDHHLIISRSLIKELMIQSESAEEDTRNKARRSLDTLKKLETLPDLNLRYSDTDFPEVKDPMGKTVRLARLLDANIITADISQVQMAMIEGVRVINLHNLSKALKPLMQTGQVIKIKVQRYGKEPRQGVGYLDDGTMVVINGGGDYLGETIDATVLSVKHTTSGRMIFCNAPDEDGYPEDHEEH